MNNGIGTIGRAFELAKDSDSIEDIRKQLKEEGHFNVDAHFSGRQIKADLRRAISQQG
ncbi:hypothetical protein WJS89_10685 [Sphingomicrobium sp. XHP0235]|uniref:hypothetical protein n=1 Tax=Sphingomicrobium aquimarinum TaxID=3133971 RepID=UPI0031FEEA65